MAHAQKILEAKISIGGEIDKSLQKSINAATVDFNKLQKKIGAFASTAVKTFATVGAASAAALAGGAVVATKALYNLGEEFNNVSNTIRIGTGATGEQLEKLEASFDKVYTALPLTKEAVATAIADINTLTGAEGKALEEFTQKALDAADMLQVDAKGLYTAAAQSFNAFGIEAEKMGEKLDYVWKVSQSTGTGMQELMQTVQQNQTTFRSLGYTYEQSIALIGQMDKAGFEASDAMSALQKAVATMAKDGVKDMGKGLQDAIDKIKNAKTESEAAGIALETFGARGGAKMAKGIRDGTIAVDELVKTLQASPESISAAADATDTIGDKWTEFKHNMEVGLKPAAESLYGAFKEFIPVLDKLAKDAMPFVKEEAEKLAVHIKAAAESFKEWVQNIDFESIKEKLSSFIGTVKDAVKWIADHKDGLLAAGEAVMVLYGTYKAIQAGIVIFNAIKTAVVAYKAAQIAAAASGKTLTVAQWALNAAMSANPIGLIIAAIAALVAAIWYCWRNWDKITAWMSGVWQAFEEKFPKTAATLKMIWEAVCAYFKLQWDIWCAALTLAWDQVCANLKLAWDLIKVYFETAWNVLKEVFSGICSLLSGDWDGFCQHFSAAGQAIIDGFKTAWNLVQTWFSGTVERFTPYIDALKNAFMNAWEVIKTKIKSVFDSIMSYIQPIIDKISSIGDSLNNIKERASSALNDIKQSKINPVNWFAAGGFTDGISICGEAGTEAVISFDPRYRKENQGYLMTAAEMLGMTAAPVAGNTTSNNISINFAPVIKSGSESNSALIAQLRACMPELVDMIEDALANRKGHRYA